MVSAGDLGHDVDALGLCVVIRGRGGGLRLDLERWHRTGRRSFPGAASNRQGSQVLVVLVRSASAIGWLRPYVGHSRERPWSIKPVTV